ncbi:phytoene desaturase family protein [Oharaeibacter diazotrophicus]|uniref:Pyridine nucleotide-disulfide oxidoreductase domain-containing protein 2 n=1 Tax=Oharaeibacter diazotrophicus TaxID=1920512 RepID=A0A4R6RA64_9HYPH|nr:NAD(P)/FAD-dependent oxidoreductase [Oharaeibacter diazotrophicus]TDP82785.1 phytoene dehydrogenase-like protein [Oharaeibacter diazotrophicus]BBE72453.1 phytoene desaturase (lycopene-forming) [Pleomorphomonas sp. SM30]GLS76484.1 FAD-dependent oxidoreductase [Oharaeibacter diazotrophicus]
MSDVVVIGGGHNGLVCAFYLASAGLKVTVLERRGVVGGAAVTEEFHPGFRNSVASYTVSLLNPRVIADMDLPRHGLTVLERRMLNFMPLPDGRALEAGPGRTKASVAQFSQKDAVALDAYGERLDVVADLLRDLVLKTPPNVVAGGWMSAIPELLKSATLGRKFADLSMEMRREILDVFTKSASDYLDRWFESDPIKALLGFDGVVGNFASPNTPGTAYVLLHHVFGEVNGKKGIWGHAVGGMGAITQAMRRACEEKGVRIVTDAAVAHVLVEKGRAVGAVTEAGDVHRARLVVSNLNPKLLYTRLVDAADLPKDFLDRIRVWKSGSGTFRMNVALSELPSFTAKPGREPADHHTAGIIVAPSLAYMDRAYLDARDHGWSREPIVEMLIPSTLDDSLAPKGMHVASLFCQHVRPELPAGFPGGSSWDDHRETVADLMIATVDRYAPGFAASVVGRQINSPLDLERTFGLVGGDIFHGALTLDQLFSARPMLGHGDYRAPIPGLYMCGSGTHPGGGVTGAPGHNAAREILRDVKRRKVA